MGTQQSSVINLLLVEANVNKSSNLQFLLSRAGYTVVIATSEEAAVVCVGRDRIHLVIIGEDFIVQHGFTLCAWLRRLFPVPIVVFAPLYHPDDLTTALKMGVDDYIIKPVPQAMLLARLATVVRRARRSRLQPQPKSGLLL